MSQLRGVLSELRLYFANYVVTYIPSHRLRFFFYTKVLDFQIGSGSSIHMGCRFDCSGGLIVGDNSTINDRCFFDTRGGICIGSNTAITSGVWISTVKHDVHSAGFEAIPEGVEIGDFVFIGRRAMILQGCKIGKGAVLGAGSVLTKSIPDFEIWAGNPARKIGEREPKEFTYSCEYMRLLF